MSVILKKLLFCAIFALISAVALYSAARGGTLKDVLWSFGRDSFTEKAEGFVNRGLPFREGLLKLGREINMASGQREIKVRDENGEEKQNGVFVGGDSLMKNIDPPVDEYVRENISAVVEFAESVRQNRKQTYVMLIPTSGAIMQRNLPRFAQSVMVNQRSFIEDIYGRVSGHVTTIDAYSALIGRQTQYIYYRTENNLTSLGGYYVYAAMLARLGMGTAQLRQFEMDYSDGSFYGDLYGQSGYTSVTPDNICLFRYAASNREPREFTVTHMTDGGIKTYHMLFPEHTAVLGHELDIFLGGISAVTDVASSSRNSMKILIFGDKTAIAYLPFLAVNCERVTIVDLSRDYGGFSDIDPLEYDKIIFAYGVESFMHTEVPARAIEFLEDYNQWYVS